MVPLIGGRIRESFTTSSSGYAIAIAFPSGISFAIAVLSELLCYPFRPLCDECDERQRCPLWVTEIKLSALPVLVVFNSIAETTLDVDLTGINIEPSPQLLPNPFPHRLLLAFPQSHDISQNGAFARAPQGSIAAKGRYITFYTPLLNFCQLRRSMEIPKLPIKAVSLTSIVAQFSFR